MVPDTNYAATTLTVSAPLLRNKKPHDPVVPQLPCSGILAGPSKSGKTVALISMLLEQSDLCVQSLDVDGGYRFGKITHTS